MKNKMLRAEWRAAFFVPFNANILRVLFQSVENRFGCFRA